MKTPRVIIVLLVVVALSIAAWTVQAQKQNAARQQWEYKVINIYQNNADKILDDLGAEGWELVAVQPSSDATAKGLYHFKRQK